MASHRRRRHHSKHAEESSESSDKSRGEEHTNKHKRLNGDRLQREHFLNPDSDQIDLNLLLDAVLDINDKLRTQEQDSSTGTRMSADDCNTVCTSRTSTAKKEKHFPVKSHIAKFHVQRQNFSFRNDQVLEIDRENQRLLKEITGRRPQSATSGARDRQFNKTIPQPVRVKTSSEVNRTRFQRRIDEENQALLRRLEAVKPTRSLNRDYLMREHGVHEKTRRRPASASRVCSSARMSSRNRTLSDYHLSKVEEDRASEKSFSGTSRPSSSRNVLSKPVWEPGW